MASIHLEDVSVHFPILSISSRSLKKNFLRVATGGNVLKDTKEHVVVRSLNNINLSLESGDRIGLIGHNGAGKTTLLRLLANIYEPTSGQLKITGEVSSLLSLMHGIEAEFTGSENIIQRGFILGLTRKEIKDRIDEIAKMTGLGDYIYMPVRTYSSGMMVRLAFAISTCINPDILLIDEVFGAGDSDFMQVARKKMIELINKSSIVVIASHSNELVKEFCNKAIVLKCGFIDYYGEVDLAIQNYQSC